MPLSDSEFDGQLDALVKSTVELVSSDKPTEFVPTLFLVYDDRIVLEALVNDEDNEGADFYDVLYHFRKELAYRNSVPDAVFVAARFLWPEDDSPCLFVSGCTHDGRKNGARLVISQTSCYEFIARLTALPASGRDSSHPLSRRNGLSEIYRMKFY